MYKKFIKKLYDIYNIIPEYTFYIVLSTCINSVLMYYLIRLFSIPPHNFGFISIFNTVSSFFYGYLIFLFINNKFKIKNLKAGSLAKIHFHKDDPIKETTLYSTNMKNIFDYKAGSEEIIIINNNNKNNFLLFLIEDSFISKDWIFEIRFFSPFKKETSRVKILYNNKTYWADPRCLKKIKS